MDGQRDIYGHSFPDGLVANQKLPTGAVVTPTTKAEQGMHDEMLTREQAKALVDSELGEGMWDKAEQLSLELFERQARIAEEKGLILADTKYEMGIVDGQLILIDEVGTPDSSRFWLLSTYDDRMKEGKTPDGFDKEILRRWLADQGFTGNEPIPEVPQEVIDAMAQAYKVPFEMLTGTTLPESDATSSTVQEATADYLTEHGVL